MGPKAVQGLFDISPRTDISLDYSNSQSSGTIFMLALTSNEF